MHWKQRMRYLPNEEKGNEDKKKRLGTHTREQMRKKQMRSWTKKKRLGTHTQFWKKSKWGATWANKELDKKETTWHTHVSEAVGLRTRDWGTVTGYWFLKMYECIFEEQKYFENKSKKVGVSGFNNCKTCPELLKELCCWSRLCAGASKKPWCKRVRSKTKYVHRYILQEFLAPTHLSFFRLFMM